MNPVKKHTPYTVILITGLLIVTAMGSFFWYTQSSQKQGAQGTQREWYEQQFRVGSALLASQDYEKAAQIFTRMIEVDPTCASVYFNQGRAFAGMGKNREALDSYRNAAEHAQGGDVKKYSYCSAGQIFMAMHLYQEALAFFDAARDEDPAYQDALLQRSIANRCLKRYDHAYEDLNAVDRATPQLALHYGVLGQEARNAGAYACAYNAFTHAASLQKSAQLLCALADMRHILAKQETQLEKIISGMHEALALYNQAALVDPHSYPAHHNAALLLSELGDVRESSNRFEHAQRVRPESLETQMCLGMNQLKLGDYGNGWRNYDARITGLWGERAHPNIIPACAVSVPRWQGEDICGKKIFMHAEQAFGDTIQFIRYARTLKERGAYVIVSVQKPLFKLMSYCPYIDQLVVQGAPEPIQADYRVPFMSVPCFLSPTKKELFDTRPYLSAPAVVVDRWKEYLAQHARTCKAKLHVAVSWQGEISHDAGCYLGSETNVPFKQIPRSVPASTFFQITAVPDVCFISVQKGVVMDELHQAVPHARAVHVLPADFDTAAGSFVDTAAIMTLVDLVISVDTSVAHLAGGLGVPTWILLPAVAEWRWKESGETTAWYPSARLFRQPAIGDWEPVVQSIQKELLALVARKNMCPGKSQP